MRAGRTEHAAEGAWPGVSACPWASRPGLRVLSVGAERGIVQGRSV